MTSYLIIGATSAIAREFARLNADNSHFYLAARNKERLELLSKDLKTRGAHSINTYVYDAESSSSQENTLAEILKDGRHIDIILIAHGTLPKPEIALTEKHYIDQQIQINALSILQAINQCASHLALQREGCLAVITSVAGDRGRESNYLYGACKAMISTYLSGLRAELARKNIHILDIKPGMIDTPMTKNFKKSLIWSIPSQVANDIQLSITKQRSVVYSPFYWRYIMVILKLIPTWLFNKFNL